ncbi:MAG: sodium-dependent transporter, partial [Actinomyces oris]
YESESYSSGFVMVFGWGMLLVVALCSAVMSLIPWKTPVDEFEALKLEADPQEED